MGLRIVNIPHPLTRATTFCVQTREKDIWEFPDGIRVHVSDMSRPIGPPAAVAAYAATLRDAAWGCAITVLVIAIAIFMLFL